MKKRYRKKNDSLASELLSDLSFSSLGLLLIIFVVYLLIFNSNSPYQKMAVMQSQLEELESDNSSLNEQNSKLKNEVLNVEQKIKRIKQQNRYTGYYISDYKDKLLENCNPDKYSIITGEQSIAYFQEAGILVHSTTANSYGTITFKYKGSLNGNVFTGSSIAYSRGENITACDTNPKIEIEFNDNSLNFGGTFGRQILRKIE